MGKYETSTKTRQVLINAAGELAAEQGIGAVTLRAIAPRAGENVGSIIISAAYGKGLSRWR